MGEELFDDSLVNSANMDTSSIPERKQSAVDDMGNEDCELVGVNLKRKRKRKPDSFDDGQPKRTKPESCGYFPFEADASGTSLWDDIKTVLKYEDNVSISDDIPKEFKFDPFNVIKTDAINLDHNYSRHARSTECNSECRDIGYSESEPISLDTIESRMSGYCASDAARYETIESVECYSNVDTPEAEFVCAMKSDSIAPVMTSCPSLFEKRHEARRLDNKAPVVDEEKPESSPFSPDYEFLTCHNQEKQSLEVDVIEEQIYICHDYEDDVSYCETISESNVMSIEPILEDTSDVLDVGNPVLDVKNTVIGADNTVLDVGNHVLDVGNDVLDVGDPFHDRNPVLDVGNPVLDVGNPVLDVGNPVLDVKNSVIGAVNTVLDVGNHVLDVQNNVLDVGNAVLDVGDPFHDKNPVLDVGNAVLDVVNPVLDVGYPVLNVGDPVLDVGNPVLDVSNPVLDVRNHVLDKNPDLDVANPVLDVGNPVLDVNNTVSSRNKTQWHVCEWCNQICIDANKLDNHYAAHFTSYRASGYYDCNVCGKKYAAHSHLMYHKKLRGHYSLVYDCKTCEKSFERKSLMEDHLKTAHKYDKPMKERNMGSSLVSDSEYEELYFCDICEQRFQHEGDLVTHLKTHTEPKPQAYIGPISKHRSKKQRSSNAILSVLDIVKLPKLRRPSKGPSCGPSTKKQTVPEPRNWLELYTCEICAQGFQHENNLTKHLAFHSKSKCQPCLICEQQLDDVGSLTTHMVSHEGSAKYMVPEYLKRHVKIHAVPNREAYVCSLCGISHSCIGDITEHLRAHKNSYPCHHCGREKLTRGVCKTKVDVCKTLRIKSRKERISRQEIISHKYN